MYIDQHLHQAVNAAYRNHGGIGVTPVRVIRPRVDELIADHVEQVLSRYSVFDLREVAGEEMERAEARLLRSEGFIGLVNSGTRNMIDWFVVASRENRYEIRRFATFWFCSCAGFTLSRTCCKHIAFIQHSLTRKEKTNDNSSIGKAATGLISRHHQPVDREHTGRRDRPRRGPENISRPAA